MCSLMRIDEKFNTHFVIYELILLPVFKKKRLYIHACLLNEPVRKKTNNLGSDQVRY